MEAFALVHPTQLSACQGKPVAIKIGMRPKTNPQTARTALLLLAPHCSTRKPIGVRLWATAKRTRVEIGETRRPQLIATNTMRPTVKDLGEFLRIGKVTAASPKTRMSSILGASTKPRSAIENNLKPTMRSKIAKNVYPSLGDIRAPKRSST
jgi:hypothetical protein